MVRRHVPGDREQPGREAFRVPERAEPVERSRERLLHHVVRLVTIVQDRADNPGDCCVVTYVELFERVFVAAAHQFDESGVASVFVAHIGPPIAAAARPRRGRCYGEQAATTSGHFSSSVGGAN